MKSIRTIVAALFTLAGTTAFAQNLVSSPASPLALSAGNGLTAFKTVTITNTGPGFASNLSLTGPTRTRGSLGELLINGQTCNGATLAPNGSCYIQLEFDSTCPKAETSSWNITLSQSGGSPLVLQINGNSRGGICA